MGAEALSPKGKAAFGAACAACCAVPMLLVAGVVSVGAFVAGGVELGSVGVVALSALTIHRRWIVSTPLLLRTVIGVLGVVLAAIGLALLGGSNDAGRPFVSGGVAALTCAGMLALARANAVQPAVPAPPA